LTIPKNGNRSDKALLAGAEEDLRLLGVAWPVADRIIDEDRRGYPSRAVGAGVDSDPPRAVNHDGEQVVHDDDADIIERTAFSADPAAKIAKVQTEIRNTLNRLHSQILLLAVVDPEQPIGVEDRYCLVCGDYVAKDDPKKKLRRRLDDKCYQRWIDGGSPQPVEVWIKGQLAPTRRGDRPPRGYKRWVKYAEAQEKKGLEADLDEWIVAELAAPVLEMRHTDSPAADMLPCRSDVAELWRMVHRPDAPRMPTEEPPRNKWMAITRNPEFAGDPEKFATARRAIKKKLGTFGFGVASLLSEELVDFTAVTSEQYWEWARQAWDQADASDTDVEFAELNNIAAAYAVEAGKARSCLHDVLLEPILTFEFRQPVFPHADLLFCSQWG
jgi:hypothetical protein